MYSECENKGVYEYRYQHLSINKSLKGKVSRDFEGLQMILMNRTWVPDVPLKVHSFLKLHFHIDFLILKFKAG